MKLKRKIILNIYNKKIKVLFGINFRNTILRGLGTFAEREQVSFFFEVTKAESIEAIGQEGKVSIEMK